MKSFPQHLTRTRNFNFKLRGGSFRPRRLRRRAATFCHEKVYLKGDEL